MNATACCLLALVCLFVRGQVDPEVSGGDEQNVAVAPEGTENSVGEAGAGAVVSAPTESDGVMAGANGGVEGAAMPEDNDNDAGVESDASSPPLGASGEGSEQEMPKDGDDGSMAAVEEDAAGSPPPNTAGETTINEVVPNDMASRSSNDTTAGDVAENPVGTNRATTDDNASEVPGNNPDAAASAVVPPSQTTPGPQQGDPAVGTAGRPSEGVPAAALESDGHESGQVGGVSPPEPLAREHIENDEGNGISLASTAKPKGTENGGGDGVKPSTTGTLDDTENNQSEREGPLGSPAPNNTENGPDEPESHLDFPPPNVDIEAAEDSGVSLEDANPLNGNSGGGNGTSPLSAIPDGPGPSDGQGDGGNTGGIDEPAAEGDGLAQEGAGVGNALESESGDEDGQNGGASPQSLDKEAPDGLSTTTGTSTGTQPSGDSETENGKTAEEPEEGDSDSLGETGDEMSSPAAQQDEDSEQVSSTNGETAEDERDDRDEPEDPAQGTSNTQSDQDDGTPVDEEEDAGPDEETRESLAGEEGSPNLSSTGGGDDDQGQANETPDAADGTNGSGSENVAGDAEPDEAAGTDLGSGPVDISRPTPTPAAGNSEASSSIADEPNDGDISGNNLPDRMSFDIDGNGADERSFRVQSVSTDPVPSPAEPGQLGPSGPVFDGVAQPFVGSGGVKPRSPGSLINDNNSASDASQPARVGGQDLALPLVTVGAVAAAVIGAVLGFVAYRHKTSGKTMSRGAGGSGKKRGEMDRPAPAEAPSVVQIDLASKPPPATEHVGDVTYVIPAAVESEKPVETRPPGVNNNDLRARAAGDQVTEWETLESNQASVGDPPHAYLGRPSRDSREEDASFGDLWAVMASGNGGGALQQYGRRLSHASKGSLERAKQTLERQQQGVDNVSYGDQRYGAVHIAMCSYADVAPGAYGATPLELHYAALTPEPGALAPEGVHRVVKEYSPDLSDEIALKPGEPVKVYRVFTDQWCVGRNLGTGQEGAFPYACVAVAQSAQLDMVAAAAGAAGAAGGGGGGGGGGEWGAQGVKGRPSDDDSQTKAVTILSGSSRSSEEAAAAKAISSPRTSTSTASTTSKTRRRTVLTPRISRQRGSEEEEEEEEVMVARNSDTTVETSSIFRDSSFNDDHHGDRLSDVMFPGGHESLFSPGSTTRLSSGLHGGAWSGP